MLSANTDCSVLHKCKNYKNVGYTPIELGATWKITEQATPILTPVCNPTLQVIGLQIHVHAPCNVWKEQELPLMPSNLRLI